MTRAARYHDRVETFVTIMFAVCFLLVPYVCFRLGIEHPSWRRPLVLVVMAAVTTPAVGLVVSYARWRRSHDSKLADPPALEVMSGGRVLYLDGTVRGSDIEYLLPNGEVMRVPLPDWKPVAAAEPRVDQSAGLAGSSLVLGSVGFASGRLVARRRGRPGTPAEPAGAPTTHPTVSPHEDPRIPGT